MVREEVDISFNAVVEDVNDSQDRVESPMWELDQLDFGADQGFFTHLT